MCVEAAELQNIQTMAGSPVKQAQASRADELRAKIAKAHAEINAVQSQIARLQRQSQSAIIQSDECITANSALLKDAMPIPDDHGQTPLDEQTIRQAREIVARYKQSVTRFNDLRDAAMGLLGLIAEKEGRTLKNVLEDRGIEDDD